MRFKLSSFDVWHSEDMEEPLTPSHLMLGRRIRSIPDDIVIEEEKENEVVILSPISLYFCHIVSFLESLET